MNEIDFLYLLNVNNCKCFYCEYANVFIDFVLISCSDAALVV